MAQHAKVQGQKTPRPEGSKPGIKKQCSATAAQRTKARKAPPLYVLRADCLPAQCKIMPPTVWERGTMLEIRSKKTNQRNGDMAPNEPDVTVADSTTGEHKPTVVARNLRFASCPEMGTTCARAGCMGSKLWAHKIPTSTGMPASFVMLASPSRGQALRSVTANSAEFTDV